MDEIEHLGHMSPSHTPQLLQHTKLSPRSYEGKETKPHSKITIAYFGFIS